MNYYLFCKEGSKIKLLDILIIILWIISLILIMLNLIVLFKISVIINVIFLFINSSIEHREARKNNKIVVDKPIVVDDKNVYILQDKSMFLMLIMGLCCIFMFLMFKLSGNMLYYFIMLVIVLMFEGNYLLKQININYLKNNIDNLYNILNGKNNKYKINKIKKITKSNIETYIIELMDQTTREVVFTEKYENYNELINILNEKCN